MCSLSRVSWSWSDLLLVIVGKFVHALNGRIANSCLMYMLHALWIIELTALIHGCSFNVVYSDTLNYHATAHVYYPWFNTCSVSMSYIYPWLHPCLSDHICYAYVADC